MKQENLVTFYKFDISENNQQIVSKIGLMASRTGSRRRAEAGPVGVSTSTPTGWDPNWTGLSSSKAKWGGSACIPTLYKGLSPQKGPSEDRHTFNSLSHLIVWGGTHFCLWRLLEHLASTVFCGKLTPLKPVHSLARMSLSQRQVCPQLDPHSLLYRLMKQSEVSNQS